jgi:uncharacterized repeat protein (TIGR03803 family)
MSRIETISSLVPVTKVLTTLHAFTGADGAKPYAGLVFDTKGALYGTTATGGAYSGGTVDPATKTLTTLHSFPCVGSEPT